MSYMNMFRGTLRNGSGRVGLHLLASGMRREEEDGVRSSFDDSPRQTFVIIREFSDLRRTMSSMAPFEHMRTPVAGQFYHVYGFKVEASSMGELGNVGGAVSPLDRLCKSWCRNLELDYPLVN